MQIWNSKHKRLWRDSIFTIWSKSWGFKTNLWLSFFPFAVQVKMYNAVGKVHLLWAEIHCPLITSATWKIRLNSSALLVGLNVKSVWHLVHLSSSIRISLCYLDLQWNGIHLIDWFCLLLTTFLLRGTNLRVPKIKWHAYHCTTYNSNNEPSTVSRPSLATFWSPIPAAWRHIHVCGVGKHLHSSGFSRI